jgi:DNA-binding NtrC family response regulator
VFVPVHVLVLVNGEGLPGSTDFPLYAQPPLPLGFCLPVNMRGSSRRDRRMIAMSPKSFGWAAPVLATLSHSSMPFGERVSGQTLADAPQIGSRDRLALLAQFAAHQAYLQFAGIADGEFDPAEWVVIQKRGTDVRLVRIGAKACERTDATLPIARAQQFAETIDVAVDVLRQPWARADAIYAEAYQRLAHNVSTDLSWTKNSALGAILSPGPEHLIRLASASETHGYMDTSCFESLRRFAELETGVRLTELRGVSPLERFSAVRAIVDDATLSPAAAAERILATSGRRQIFVIEEKSAFDQASLQLVEILAAAGHGSWIIPEEPDPLPVSQRFIIAPRIAPARRLTALTGAEIEAFVESTEFGAYIERGVLPPERAPLPSLPEPRRSFLGALALLGPVIHWSVACEYLQEFLVQAPIEDFVFEGVTSAEGPLLRFASESVREEAERVIPAGSRASICAMAARHAEGTRAALLWLDAGEPVRAIETLESIEWTDAEEVVRVVGSVPPSIVTPLLRERHAHALVDCGRYRDAIEIAGLLDGDARELVIARAERRMGDYAAALARLATMQSQSFESSLLRAELLRLTEREDLLVDALDACIARTEEERVRLEFERSLLALDKQESGEDFEPGHYLAARLATYAALERNAFEDAARHAETARRLVRNTCERVDASLDRMFIAFTAGLWADARAIGIEALLEIEETQGDRGAGGILFTLAYLAADEAQWSFASQQIARLRRYYSHVHDELRFGEIELLTAHLDFCRGRFGDARRGATVVLQSRARHDQIREAAALILDEIDLFEGGLTSKRSTGKSGNAELTRRFKRLTTLAIDGDEVCDQLFAFRLARSRGEDAKAREIAERFGLELDEPVVATDREITLLHAAATREFPFDQHDFDVAWCFATRNRLGQWNASGPREESSERFQLALEEALDEDWIVVDDDSVLFFAGSSSWTTQTREALAALFRVRAENHRMHRVIDQEEASRSSRVEPVDGIVGQSAAIRELFGMIAKVARRDVAVCIMGESGTGKELAARAIHRYSPRRPKSFTAVNCAALPENLIESELFGHVRGAFTGADRDRAGLIETTDGGTLFLDEIGEMPLSAQAKLLRFLQEGEFRRVGDSVNRTADVRIVSATNRKLEAAVEEGRFRDDLYYRIRGVEVLLPALRDRGGDVLLLAQHFLSQERDKHRGGATSLSHDVEAILTSYSWPGNVRELQNAIRAAHAMAGDTRQIDVEHLPERLRSIVPARVTTGSYQDAVTRFKRDLIERSLVQTNGNQNRAASLLRMSRQALAYQIRELGILVKQS